MPDHEEGVPKLETGIPGFDHVSIGGLPRGRTALVLGSAGSGKTVLGGQFLAEGCARGEGGIFVSLEEPTDDLRRNLGTLGFDIGAWERAEQWRFIDASPVLEADGAGVARYPVQSLAARIGHEVDVTSAQRVVLDSVNTLLQVAEDPVLARQQLRSLLYELRRMGLTVMLTVEARTENHDAMPYGSIEEFVADTVILLRNELEEDKRRRTLEILKMRGAAHRKGQFPFTVLPGQGVVVIPLSNVELASHSSEVRVSSGIPALDEMCQGGFFRDSIVLASGATGTGKTLMVSEFMAAGAENGERSLLFAFEESRDQMFRNARGWGRDFAALEEQGSLRVVAMYPEIASLEDHLVEIKRGMDEFQPQRIAIDSLSALERIGTVRTFREFIIGLTSFVKERQVAALFTSSTPSLLGGTSITDTHISTLTDSIILLRYVEVFGAVKRAIAVLKMRGSQHDHEIREFHIDGDGMHIGEAFRGVGGILTGHVVNLATLPDTLDNLLPPS